MGYLICENCGGYYKLQPEESINDFEGCSCGGKFKLVESLEDYSDTNPENIGEEAPIKEDKINNTKPDTDKLTKKPSAGEEKCPNCGAENNKGAIFCKTCGYNFNSSSKITDLSNHAEIEKTKLKNEEIKDIICSKCGEKNLSNAKFCAICGTELTLKKSHNYNIFNQVKTWFLKLSPKKRLISFFVIFLVLAAIIYVVNSSSNPYTTAYTSESEEEYMKSCVNNKINNKINIDQISKNPDKYRGERIYWWGSTFQVMENGDKTNIIMGANKPEGYVFFDGTTPIVDNKVIYVFGEVYGSYSYTSQANYQITLPAVTAKYIVIKNDNGMTIYPTRTGISSDYFYDIIQGKYNS